MCVCVCLSVCLSVCEYMRARVCVCVCVYLRDLRFLFHLRFKMYMVFGLAPFTLHNYGLYNYRDHFETIASLGIFSLKFV